MIELHTTHESHRPEKIRHALEQNGIETIWASSKTRLSKYHTASPEEKAAQIFVVDQYDRLDKPAPIGQSTEIFKRYEGARIIDRIYVAPENYAAGEKILVEQKL